VGILTSLSDESLKNLVKHLKAKSFTEMRKWVGENSDIDQTTLFRRLYDEAIQYVKQPCIPSLVLILAEYQYKAAFVADQEINLAACFTQIMADCEFV